MEKLTCKVQKDNQKNEFYVVSTNWNEDNLTLSVIDYDKAWKGKMESEQVLKLSEAVHKTKEEYVKELKHAFSESGREFTFIVDGDNFIVKKIDLKSNIKIKFCIISLEELPAAPTYLTLLSDLLDQMQENKREMLLLAQEVQNFKVEREDFQRKLLQFCNEKASLETLLYSKFCEILNSKKKRIVYLESQIGAGGESTSLQNSADTFHSYDTNQKSGRKIAAKENLRIHDNSANKRKGSEQNSKSKKVLKDNIFQSASEVKETNSDHYDSETDIDTDEEICENNLMVASYVRTASSSLDALEDTPPKLLPKRVYSSSILLKEDQNNMDIMVNESKEFKTSDVDPSDSLSNNKFEEEFNSQSLLDDC